ncbi:MAG TPA: radical SAM protein [Acidimicrobiales bacterium]|nr:radical SAM protein [Acidimicrobiales bacterium]
MGPTGDRAILQLHPTRRCNLRCLHCYSQSGPDVSESQDVGLLTQAVEDAAALGYDVAGVSGGEPLLYRPLPALLRAARAAGMRTTVTTNGMVLTERKLEELAGLVDVLAISLDGTPASHVEMRGDANAFSHMERWLPAVRASGVAFGFITTLTMHNAHELAWVADFAREQGASLLQIHPLELEGNAVERLPSSVPDATELAFAFVESLRLRGESDLAVQLDVVRRGALQRAPERFLAGDEDLPSRLGGWLSPLVIETSGRVVPLTYGLDPRFALGVLTAERSLASLAQAWSPAPFRRLCRDVHARLTAGEGPEFVNWYEEVARAARGAPAVA